MVTHSACGGTARLKAQSSTSTATWRLRGPNLRRRLRSFRSSAISSDGSQFHRRAHRSSPKSAPASAACCATRSLSRWPLATLDLLRSLPTGESSCSHKPTTRSLQTAMRRPSRSVSWWHVARRISLSTGIENAAQELRKTNSLIGTALRLLTDDAANQNALKTSLGTLTRVLDAVDWPTITKDKPEAWLYFYEDFLEVYDNKLRKRTGSYYTPPEVVAAMVSLVDEALRGRLFERPTGFAASDVVVADPAVGTGTFLLGVLRTIATTVSADQGPGAVRGAIEAAAKRVIGFEIQFGPFAVAQLRLMAEMQALMKTPKNHAPALPDLHLFITDTLGNPFVEEE